MTQPKKPWSITEIPMVVTYEEQVEAATEQARNIIQKNKRLGDLLGGVEQPKKPGINPGDYWLGGHYEPGVCE